MTESAGNPQDLLTDPSTTFVEEDDDALGDEPSDDVDEIDAADTSRRPRRAAKDCRRDFACATTRTTWTT